MMDESFGPACALRVDKAIDNEKRLFTAIAHTHRLLAHISTRLNNNYFLTTIQSLKSNTYFEATTQYFFRPSATPFIDAQKKAEQELKYIAFHDVLTGLANRKQLELSFDFALAYAKRHQTKIAILFMDLDCFKQINDNYGHDVGDFLLAETARRLKESLRSIDIIVRLGGDEFIIVLTELIDVEQVPNITKKILSSIAKQMTIKYHDISITGSIGISLYPDDSHDLITLMKQADEALYRVKLEGRNNFQFFC